MNQYGAPMHTRPALVFLSVQVTGAVRQALTPAADDLAKMPRATVRTTTNMPVEATDGYHVVFSLAEPDPAFIDIQILPADTANGKPLSGSQGRFRFVAPKENCGARSIRIISRLYIVQLRQQGT